MSLSELIHIFYIAFAPIPRGPGRVHHIDHEKNCVHVSIDDNDYFQGAHFHIDPSFNAWKEDEHTQTRDGPSKRLSAALHRANAEWLEKVAG